jgi:hypothetical protein
MPPGIVASLAVDHHRTLGEDRGGVKQGAMMFPAVETVADAHPGRTSRSDNPDIAAKATAGELVHARLHFAAIHVPKRLCP